MKQWVRWAAAIGAALALSGCGQGVDGRRIENPDPAEWLTYGRTYDEQRFSPLKQIDGNTVGRLGVAWWAEFDTDRGQEATPLVHDGVLYTTTAWSKVYAFDAKTGKRLWAYDPKVPGEAGFNACCDVVNRGVALWKGRVYVGTIDGRLVALDARTGEVAWSVQTTDRSRPYTITGAPRVIKGRVLIGNGGAEYGVRGYVSAYDAASGKLAWRFYTTPNPKGAPDGAASDKVFAEKAAATWSDGAWKQTGGGGTVWDAITYDPGLDLVFVGVGNGTPWNHKLRSGGQGDNLFLASIVALRPDTGEYVWHYQTTPGESWDYTATQHIMLADLPIGGQTRRVVMQAPKNGFFYVLDARTGQLLSAEKFVPVDWAERIDLKTGRPVETPGARYLGGSASNQMVGALGGHNWHPMAFSPKAGLVYIPAQYNRGFYADPDSFAFTPGAWNTGMLRPARGPTTRPRLDRPAEREPVRGELIAWDPVAQKKRWSVVFPQMATSGILATEGGLVFHSALGRLTAYDAATGRPAWSYDLGARAIAPASTYAIDGEQYLALMVGAGGAGSRDVPRQKGRLVVFKLGGTAKPPPYPAPVDAPPLDLALATPSKGDADRGAATFANYCANCHGAGPYFPNLARSPAILEPDGFKAIVHDGALKDRGMAGFSRFFDVAATEDLRAYLLWAAKTAPPEPPKSAPAHGQ
ncbi:MAG: PQQ-dependent dehydrogenase, methanol/ethanol family [Phenylobacterium sp.]|uniref:PQQ-dependent dehydrogenase, methanol/ethanol family n=1 Tax=Phenylobacterium sp. TaxID=1871053 RepID=UPI001A544A5B|nr:PQQ-dependent dehydrogenase, methanol/ethanol family [Phenylobacterium sp.]MBL8770928.1 PQQ-dependent dehydrogenase, methanol/ethanol family [Phenylobacterium sp.]